MGSGSSYSVSEDDKVYLVGLDDDQALNSSRKSNDSVHQSNTVGRSTEFTIDLQVPFSLFPNWSLSGVASTLAISSPLHLVSNIIE